MFQITHELTLITVSHPTDKPMNQSEPVISINGVSLNSAQAMTVRVAIENFSMDLKTSGLGTDELGMAITNGYLRNIEGIRKVMYKE